jgi:nucleotide-binding universal stress UspA family protein
MDFKRVVIAVDESVYSKRAADVGVKLALKLNADVTLIHVITPVSTMGNLDAEIMPGEIEFISIDSGKVLLDEIALTYSSGKQFEKVVKIGDPAIEIIKYANTWSADLIVIARHGLESLRHLVFGGVVDEVATHTQIPVLLVPFDDKK